MRGERGCWLAWEATGGGNSGGGLGVIDGGFCYVETVTQGC